MNRILTNIVFIKTMRPHCDQVKLLYNLTSYNLTMIF